MVKRTLGKRLEEAEEQIKQLKRANRELAYKNRMLREELDFLTAMVRSDNNARSQ